MGLRWWVSGGVLSVARMGWHWWVGVGELMGWVGIGISRIGGGG